MSKASETVVFEYNADGLRVRKIATSTGTTHYTLHGKQITHLTNGNNTLHFFYDASGKPAMVEWNNGTTTAKYAYIHNLQGDIVALIDDTGAKVVSYTYDAWGKPLSTTGSLAATLGKLNPFRYRGYVYDEETDLYYLRSRYYYSNWCRFLNADVLLFATRSCLSCNIFVYCKNAPVTQVDTNGTESTYCTQMEQYNKMLLFLDMTTFNCYGYAMSYNYMPTNMIPGGIENFAKNVDKSTGKNFNKISQYDPAFFNSRNVMNHNAINPYLITCISQYPLYQSTVECWVNKLEYLVPTGIPFRYAVTHDLYQQETVYEYVFCDGIIYSIFTDPAGQIIRIEITINDLIRELFDQMAS